MILRAVETVVSSRIGELDKDVARTIILLASGEMTRAKVCGHLPLPAEASGLAPPVLREPCLPFGVGSSPAISDGNRSTLPKRRAAVGCWAGGGGSAWGPAAPP